MEKDAVFLYNSRWMQIRTALIGVILGVVILWDSYKDRATAKAPEVGYFFGSLLLIVGIFFTRSFFQNKPAMILSKLGIDFQHDGFFSWDMIDSFSVTHYTGENSSTDLILHFRWRSNLSVSLSMLEKDWEEVVEQIQRWNSNTGMYYRGSHKK